MQRLYLGPDPSAAYSHVWRNFCEHLHAQIQVRQPDLPDRAYQMEWKKSRDLHLAQWQAQLCSPRPTASGLIKSAYLEFPDAESLLAFELAWS